MASSILYAFALLGALTAMAFAGLMLVVLVDRRGCRRAAHRKARDGSSSTLPTPIA
jgi:hypothetical protein